MTSRLSKWLVVATISVIVTGFGVGYGQESTTPQEASPKVTKSKPQQKRAKSTPKTAPETVPTVETTGEQTTTVAAQEPAATVTTSPTEQTDLSGTYAGTFNCDELGLTGDTTLTVTGNQFTTADGKSGRIVAATTKGYTAVALQMGNETGSTPMIVSMRGRKTGDKLTLTSVDAAAHPCSFAPARAIASRRSRRAEPVAPAAAVGTEVANPAEAGPSPADVTGAPTRKTKRTRKAAAPTSMPPPAAVPTESPATVPVPTQSPEPEPSQTPRPAPKPSPSPSPTGSPSPSPEPSPSASPGPSPSPSPSPAPKRP